LAIGSVRYKRLGNGYELDIVQGWMGQPALSYPPPFWHGLGVVSSHVAGRRIWLGIHKEDSPGLDWAARASLNRQNAHLAVKTRW
jgi:hypothetical protein